MSTTIKHTHIKPTELYHRMLEIGAKCIHCGVNYQTVKSELCKDKCLDETEMDQFLFYWFDKVYVHKDPCELGEPKNYKDYLDNHLKVCQHYMNSDAVTQMHNFETANTDKWLNRIAIGIAVISLVISLFLEKCTTSNSENLLTNLSNQSNNSTLNQTTQIDLLKEQLNLLRNQKNQDSMFYMNMMHNSKFYKDSIPKPLNHYEKVNSNSKKGK